MNSLSICIPTYKRPEMLRRCVQSAICSAEGRPISIFIADDSMSDVNQQVLHQLTAAYPYVHYQRNPENLGIDRNIQRVLDMGDTDYLWIIGEDDLFLPGAVARIFDLLQGVTYRFVFSNYQYVSENHDAVIGIALKDAHEGEIPVIDFIEKYLWSIGFIGACIIRRTDWKETPAAPYDGTYFTHVGRIVGMLTATSSSMYISASPAIANRAQGDDTFTWKKDSFGVFSGFERMCRIAISRNPNLRQTLERAIQRYRKKFGYFSIKTAFRLRSEGAFDFRQFRTYIIRSDISLLRKSWFLLMAASPIWLLKPLAKVYICWAAHRTSALQS